MAASFKSRYTMRKPVIVFLFALLGQVPCSDATLSSVLQHIEGRKHEYYNELKQLIAIPSVSALPQHIDDIKSAALFLENKLKYQHLENVQVIPTTGPQPAVYADWLHAGPSAPTVLIYGHYDVQPVDPVELWHSGPFDADLRDGYFYGRGVSDDKGALLQALQAVGAYLNSTEKLPVNVKIIIEGQEEILSPNMPQFVRDHKDLLSADLVVSADGDQPSETKGALSLGMRGVMNSEITITTAATDMHSGIRGGSVPNANHVLVAILAGLHKEDGSISVPGYYDDVAPITEEDEELMDDYEFDAAEELESFGMRGHVGEGGFSTLARRWHRPTLEIVGMTGGFTEQGIKTVIPSTASAKISSRLAPGMDPRVAWEKLHDYLFSVKPHYANMTVTLLGQGSRAWSSTKDSPGNAAAAKVITQLMGSPPVFKRSGASIPILADFQTELKVPITVFGWGSGENIHAPNERLSVRMYDLGREAWVRFLWELGVQAGREAMSVHEEL